MSSNKKRIIPVLIESDSNMYLRNPNLTKHLTKKQLIK
jgi:hypothetical protein